MGGEKLIKDPVHGYITVSKEFCRLFIDTPVFQRLRLIEQTSMRWLFPGARHDRFIHSLGVFHLASRIYESIKGNVQDDEIKKLEEQKRLEEQKKAESEIPSTEFEVTEEEAKKVEEEAKTKGTLFKKKKKRVKQSAQFAKHFDENGAIIRYYKGR